MAQHDLTAGGETDGNDAIDDLLWELGHASAFAVKPGLERIRALLARLGDPHIGLPVLHVGGTAGKGSTATLAAAVLRAAGYRVGLHTKPHLARVNERIVVDGAEISDASLRALIAEAAPAARLVEPSWYELTVALALLHFRRVAVDIAVVEVGMGGTWDGTNVVEPRVAALTNVGLDHTEILGDTVELIAADKAGIIKSGGIAVSGVTQPSVRAIVEARAAAVSAPLWLTGRDFAVREVTPEADGSRFALDVRGTRHEGLRVGLLGAHQVTNAAVAVAATSALTAFGYSIPAAALRHGLASARLPGRLEVVATAPTVVLDGAHNPDKLAALLAALRQFFPGGRLVVVAAFTARHDYRAMLAMLAQPASAVSALALTRFESRGDFGPGASLDPATLAATLAEVAPAATAAMSVIVEPDPVTAVRRARAEAGATGCVCVTGSLYLVGAVRGAFAAGGASGAAV